MFSGWRNEFRSRWAVLAAIGALAAGRSCAEPAPAPASIAGLSELLARASKQHVAAGAFVWEPSRGALLDLLHGRHALFLAASAQGQPRDLWRARVTLTWEGKPLLVRQVVNLTRTAVADETALRIEGPYATYSTLSQGAVTAVSALDTRGVDVSEHGWLGGLAHLRALQTQGSWAGLQALHFLTPGARDLTLKLQHSQLTLELGKGAASVFDLGAPELAPVGTPAAASTAIEAWRQPLFEQSAWHTARSALLAGLGSERFDAWSARWARHEPAASTAKLAPSAASPQSASPTWPPARLALPSATNGEGEWRALAAGPARTATEPQLLFHTSLTLEGSERRLELVALDLRRLELRLAPGYAAPHAQTGPSGPGRVPAALRPKLVAAFNGGPVLGAAGIELPLAPLGQVNDERVLVPPQSGGYGVVVTQSGSVGMGPWPSTGALPSDIRSLRQTGRPLLELGSAVQPDAPRGAELVERSALCRTAAGVLIYAWTKAATRQQLQRGLVQAGCEDVAELDGTPGGLGLMLAEFEPGGASAKKLLPEMGIADTQYLTGSPRDFFYLVQRSSAELGDGLQWHVSPGAQPEPDYVPGLFASQTRVGELQVELFLVDAERVQWRVIAGQGEPLLPGSGAPVRELSEEEQARTLFAFNLGHTTRATRYGLVFGERETLPLRRVYPTLVLAQTGGFDIIAEGERSAPQAGSTQVQLPALLAGGELTVRAQERGAQRLRAALCVNTKSKLLAAFVEHDSSAPLAIVLRDAGCQSVLELDRASQHSATFYRSGTRLQLPQGSETSLLVGLSQPMAQRTFRFGAAPPTLRTAP